MSVVEEDGRKRIGGRERKTMHMVIVCIYFYVSTQSEIVYVLSAWLNIDQLSWMSL